MGGVGVVEMQFVRGYNIKVAIYGEYVGGILIDEFGED